MANKVINGGILATCLFILWGSFSKQNEEMRLEAKQREFNMNQRIDLLEINAVLTLVDYAIADHNLPFKVLDYLFTKLDKASIEESMTFGTLDLDEYSFTITLIG